MKNRAYLVNFSITTRVIVNENMDEDELDEFLFETARDRIKEDTGDYLCYDNMDYEEDKECTECL